MTAFGEPVGCFVFKIVQNLFFPILPGAAGGSRVAATVDGLKQHSDVFKILFGNLVVAQLVELDDFFFNV